MRSIPAAAMIVSIGLACVSSGQHGPAATGGEQADGSAESASAEPRRYLGTKKCRMCHSAQYESWQERPKGQSWEALKPGVAVEVKHRAGLDPSRDYTADVSCLPCHSVGFGRPGGYAVPPPRDAKAARAAATREGVGCEACHGPGSEFVKIMEQIYRFGRAYNLAELRAAGRRTVGPEVCNECHNERAICMGTSGGADGGWRPPRDFRVEVGDRRGFHAHIPRDPAAIPRGGAAAAETDD